MTITAYTREFKKNLHLAFPIMLGQLGHVMVALADNIMVGRLGAAPLAAVSLGNSLVFIAMSLGIGFSFAITPLIAETDGAKDVALGRNYFQHGIIMCGINGIMLFVALLFAKPLLNHMDQPPEVVALAIPYMEVIAFSLIPLMIFQAFKQFADGLSNTRFAMYATLAANVVNVLFNYLLIYGKLGFPEMGLVGAGYGTLISRIFMVLLLIFILKNRTKFKPYFEFKYFKNLRWSVFKRLFLLGFPTALQMFFEVALFTSCIFLSGILGTNAQAANQIALNLASMTFMIATGFGVTATIRVGNQKGMKDFPNLRRIAFSLFLQVFLIMGVFALGFIALKNILPAFYIDNAEVVYIASQLLIIAAIFQLSDGLQVVILGSLRGLQDVTVPMVICFIAYWVVGFPVAWYFGKEEIMGSQGIWLGLFAGLTTSALLLFIRFNQLSKKQIANFNLA